MFVAASLGGLQSIMQSLWQIITGTVAECWFLTSIVLFPAELPDNVAAGNCDVMCVCVYVYVIVTLRTEIK